MISALALFATHAEAQHTSSGKSKSLGKSKNNVELIADSPGASGPMIFVKGTCQHDNDGNVTHGVLGKSYGIDRKVTFNDDSGYRIIVNSGTSVDFYGGKPSYESDFHAGLSFFYGTLRGCTLAQTQGLLCWGFSDSVVFPKGSKIEFTEEQFTSKEMEHGIPKTSYYMVRVSKVTMGQDFKLPELGLVKRGTVVTFTHELNEFDRGNIEVSR